MNNKSIGSENDNGIRFLSQIFVLFALIFLFFNFIMPIIRGSTSVEIDDSPLRLTTFQRK